MARNLRAKMPQEDVLVVHDIDQRVVEKFVDESGRAGEQEMKMGGESSGVVEVGRSVREMGERCVCLSSRINSLWC